MLGSVVVAGTGFDAIDNIMFWAETAALELFGIGWLIASQTLASYVDGGGNLDADPLFILPVDPATAPTTAGNLRLQRSSPAIDAGDNDFVTVPLDLDGNPRIADGDMDGVATVDMGAYEAPTHDLYLPLVLRRRAE